MSDTFERGSYVSSRCAVNGRTTEVQSKVVKIFGHVGGLSKIIFVIHFFSRVWVGRENFKFYLNIN